MSKIFLKTTLVALVLCVYAALPAPAFAAANTCAEATSISSTLTAGCTAFYNTCTQSGNNAADCSNTAQAYVIGKYQYDLCTGQGANTPDCSGFNRQQEDTQLRQEYVYLVPNDRTIDVGSLPTMPPAADAGSQSGSQAQTQQTSNANPTATTVTAGTNTSGNKCVDPLAGRDTSFTPAPGQACPAGFESKSNGVQTIQTNGNLPPYIALEPIPGLNQSGQVPFGVLLDQLFKILIIIGQLVTVGAFVYAGIMYMMSDTMSGIENAKKRLWACVWGLLLLISSWLILYTINPQLVMFGGGLNPQTGNFAFVQQQATSDPIQQDRAACVSEGGKLQVYQSAGGAYQNCAQIKGRYTGTCADRSSGTVCVTPPQAYEPVLPY